MIERLDDGMREHVAQRVVDALHLDPRASSTTALQVGFLMVVTSIAITMVWAASLGVLDPSIGVLAVLSTGAIGYLVRVQVRRIDSGDWMLPATMIQRVILVLMAFNNALFAAVQMMLTTSRSAHAGNASCILGWAVLVLGIYFRMCRKPPPRRTTKHARTVKT